MANERITENIVRKKFEQDEKNGFLIEEQKSSNARITKLLKNASKRGDNVGKPEFIITSKIQPELLIVVECKGDSKKHQSKNLDSYADYAVDGALLYSSYLSKEYDVISIGVSGQSTKELKVSSFLQLRSDNKAREFSNQLLSLIDMQEMYLQNEGTKLQRYEDLLEFNRDLNFTLHQKKIQEDKRSLLISGILIALEYRVFKESYRKYETAKELADALVSAITSYLKKSNLQSSKIESLEGAYNFIKTHKSISEDRDFLIELISDVEKRINSFVKTYKYYDIFGEFYIEFLRYANNDKGLGIVLTPKHITELFVEMANVNKDSVVLDNCCGTGGFLITAMRKMIKDAAHDTKIEKRIKESQIIGIEYQDTIFPLACSNMIIHDDGKTNIINDSCFKDGLVESIRKQFSPNVGLLNPPYKVKKGDKEELEFVLNCLEGLEKNATCIALVPIQCAIAQTGVRLELKKRILNKHTLEAVVTLPNDLFYNSNASVVTCGIVIKAHVPHQKEHETYFGIWKDDGFIKHKSKGLIDSGVWVNIKSIWLQTFKNKKEKLNLSVMHEVKAVDEWCAEAYIETDYTKLTRNDFKNAVHNFVVHQFKNEWLKLATDEKLSKDEIEFDVNKWKSFDYAGNNGIFTIEGGFYNKKPIDKTNGEIPFLGASAQNYGITSWHDANDLEKIFPSNQICVTNNGSTGCAYYLDRPFTCSHDINVLRVKNFVLNPFIALFLCAVIEAEKFRWDYGRKWRPIRMVKSKIKLPVDKNGNPDWKYMENYVKSLPYSKNLSLITADKPLPDNYVAPVIKRNSLSDQELIDKYEDGGINLSEAAEKMINYKGSEPMTADEFVKAAKKLTKKPK